MLQLKKHEGRTFGNTPEKRMGNRRHLLVRFNASAGPEKLRELTGMGVRIVQFIPDFAYVISVPDEFAAAGPAIAWSGPFAPEDKLSGNLSNAPGVAEALFALVEFYPDVDMNAARSMIGNAELQIRENADLLNHHLLVTGTKDAITALAQWDEVAYIFPAADELVQGIPLNACAGALTDSGPIGQSVAKVGDGWDGPGLGKADLFYTFAKLTSKIEPSAVKDEIVRAFQEWAKYAKLSFTPIDGAGSGNRTLSVLFGSGEHGDAFPFDGPNGVLAHTFYPSPASLEPLAGDLHFDDEENWHVGSDIDLFSVALHETGHALGLGHSDRPGSVMYPYYQRSKALTQDDIGAILTLYAAQTTTEPTTPALLLTIHDPGLSTSASSITLSGAASGGEGPLQVSWTSPAGLSRNAVGSTAWTIAEIPLAAGSNLITIDVIDSSGATAHQTVTVSRTQVAVGRTPPMLNIVSPASATYVASSAGITLSGTASDISGIGRVTWSTSSGSSGQASGTQNWVAGPVVLAAGNTTITITAYTLSGLTVSGVLQVSYTPPAGPPVSSPPAVDVIAPTLTIVLPALTTISTSSTSISFTGTAKDNTSVTSVYWSTSNGDSGVAEGTDSWKIPAIPLLVGTNTITIKARDAALNTAWRSVIVTRH